MTKNVQLLTTQCMHTCQVLKVGLHDIAKNLFEWLKGKKHLLEPSGGVLPQKILKIECLRLAEIS